MSELINQHLTESKKQIEDLANKVMLDKEDLEMDNRKFAALRQKAENTILSDYLIDLTNKRIEDLEIYINDEIEIENYKTEIIQFLRKTVKEKI